jgi:hypothetical protein
VSLMDLLLQAPSAQSQFQQIAPLLGGGAAPVRDPMRTPATGSGDWEQAARRYFMQQEGYSRPDWRAVDSIISRESNWDPNAVNESSGAYGIPQILPSAHPNANLQNDPMGQIRWLADYIEGRYGSPQSALSFKDEHGWY